MTKKTFDEAKQTYLNHAQDRQVIRKLTPAHILGIKKLEIEERKLQLGVDALRAAVLGKLMGGPVVEGEINEPKAITESGEGTGEE